MYGHTDLKLNQKFSVISRTVNIKQNFKSLQNRCRKPNVVIKGDKYLFLQ